MKEIVLSGQNDIEKYGEDFSKEEIERYKGLSQEQLAREILTKFDNNRIGLQYNERLQEKYFTDELLMEIKDLINSYPQTIPTNTEQKEKITKELLKVYFQSGISRDDVKTANERFAKDTAPTHKKEENKSIPEQQ